MTVGSMNYNPFELSIGETVLLDEQYANWSIVEIVSFSPSFMYAKIREPFGEDTWQVMTNRLTPCERGIKITRKSIN